MPYIQITIAGASLGSDHRRALMAAFTEDVHRLLGKRREVTAVSIAELPAGAWGVNGVAVDSVAAHAEITITAGTNTPAQKSEMVAAADACLRRILGFLPDATYVVVREIAADAWGYAGRTQQARAQARQGS